MKKCIIGFVLCLIMTLFFSINVEAANKVVFNSENNDYFVELLIEESNLKIDEEKIDDYEEFYGVKIKNKNDVYSIKKEYTDFIQIDPEQFSAEWTEIVAGILENSSFKLNLSEEIVGFLYSGIRYFTINFEGLEDDLEVEINIPKNYISYFSTVSNINDDQEISSFDKINFIIKKDNVEDFVIQTIDYNNIEGALISTDISNDKKVVSRFEIDYKENVPSSILEAIGNILNLQDFTINTEKNIVTFYMSYDSANYFSALHYKDIYNFLGVIGYIEMKDGGIYSKNKELAITFSEVNNIQNIKYEVVNEKGNVKVTKGKASDKTMHSAIVDIVENSNFEISSKATNGYAIFVTISVVFMFGMLFVFAYFLYKKSR